MPAAASRVIWSSWGVSWSVVPVVRSRLVSPAARSSRQARSAQAVAVAGVDGGLGEIRDGAAHVAVVVGGVAGPVDAMQVSPDVGLPALAEGGEAPGVLDEGQGFRGADGEHDLLDPGGEAVDGELIAGHSGEGGLRGPGDGLPRRGVRLDCRVGAGPRIPAPRRWPDPPIAGCRRSPAADNRPRRGPAAPGPRSRPRAGREPDRR